MLLTRSERAALRRAIGLLELNWKRVALAVLFGTLGLGASIALTSTSAWLIARASQMPHVLTLSVAAVGVRTFGISRSVFRYMERLASHHVALNGMSVLREQVYRALAASPVERVAGLRRGDLLVRTGTDVDAVGDLVVRALLPAAVALTTGLGTVAFVAWLSPAAALILLASLALAAVVGPLLAARAARRAELEQLPARADIAADALTMVEGGVELTVSGRLGALQQRLADDESRLARLQDRAARPAAVAAGVDVLAMGIAVLGAILVGLPDTLAGALNPVELAVVVLTPLAAFEGTGALTPAAMQLVRSAGAAQRIVDLIGQKADERTATIPADAPAELVATELSVGWPGGPLIAAGIDVELHPGKAIAIVGPSGIGKTTLLATLAGLLPPRAGSVRLAGVELSRASRASATRFVTMTAEDAHVFATTVLENLRVARGDLTADEAHHLLDAVGLTSWVQGLPHGLNTPLGADGADISGGERRRLLIARALASPAPLLLIDEPAEHLDAATAVALMSDLLQLRNHGRGIAVVTHHLSALQSADEVLWLDTEAGVTRIVARGTHAQLMRYPAYRAAQEVQ